MKKLNFIIYALFVTMFSFGLRVDYGATIDSYAGTNFNDTSAFFGFEKISAYSNISINDSFSLIMDGFFKYSYNVSSPDDNKWYLDLSTLIATINRGKMTFNVGRTQMGDYSGKILSSKLDGVTFSTTLGPGLLLANAGYTGLINDNELSIIRTDAEESLTGDVGNVSRIVEGADYVINLKNTAIWVTVISQQDLTSISTNTSVYGGAGVSGAITSDVLYTLSGCFQTGAFQYLKTDGENGSVPLIAGMGSLNILWFIKGESEMMQKLQPFASLDFGMSSGDSNLNTATLGVEQADISKDGVNLFSPITSGGPGAIYSIDNQNLTYVKIKGSVSPLSNLQTELAVVAFFRTVKGATSDSAVMVDEDGNYLGTEVSAAVNYRFLSDVGVTLNGGVFAPDGTVNTGDFTGMLGLYISLSM